MHFASRLTSVALALAVASSAYADTKINLSASAEKVVENDTMLVILSTENTSSDTQTLYGLTNIALSQVATKSNEVAGVKVKPGARSMTPIYSKVEGEENKITGWRERAEVELESKQFPELYALVGDVLSDQNTTLRLRNVRFTLSDDTSRAVGDELYVTALKNIKSKAQVVSKELGKPRFEIEELSFNGPFTSGGAPVMMMRAKMESLRSPAGLEAGESSVRVDLSGSFTPKFEPDL